MCNATINSRYSFPKLAKVDLDEFYGLALVIHLSTFNVDKKLILTYNSFNIDKKLMDI